MIMVEMTNTLRGETVTRTFEAATQCSRTAHAMIDAARKEVSKVERAERLYQAAELLDKAGSIVDALEGEKLPLAEFFQLDALMTKAEAYSEMQSWPVRRDPTCIKSVRKR